MVLPIDKFQKQLDLDWVKLNTILLLQKNAPEEFKKNTEHLSHITTLIPYVYYTALVRKHLTKKSKILDWGAYLGQVTYLLQADFDIHAYNPQKQAEIQYWHQKLGIKSPVFGKDFTKFKLNFESDSFDAAISSGVLEHTFEYGIEDTDALRNLNRILKPGGLLFIWNLPTVDALAEKIAMGKRSWKHVIRYDLDGILTKLSLAGFDVLEVERNELFFNKLAKMFPWLPAAKIWQFDQWLCRLPVFNKYAHHFTIVAKKINNFPVNPAVSSYTTYTK